jgi:hypothetical protein
VTDSPPFGEGFSFINRNGEKNMDRKLFFSYIQNMQTNNPDMIGFQNSMTKNSWLKPRSIVEMNGGGHVYQDAFDAEDRRRQSVEDAAEKEIKGVDFADVAEKAYNDLLSGANDLTPVQGTFDGFAHNPDAFHRGEGKYTVKPKFAKNAKESVIVPIDAELHLGEHLPRGISDKAKEMAHERFMDALNKHHDYITGMEAEADARDWHADRQMTHGGGNPPLHESSWSSAMRKARSENQTPMTVETNPKSPTDINYVDDEGFRQLGERMRGLAARHLRTMGNENHPSSELNDAERKHYENILQEIQRGEHDEPLMGLIKDAMYDPKDPVHGWQYVHSYAASLIPQRISADIKDRVNSSILGGARRMSGMGQSRYFGASDRLQGNVYDAEDYRIRRGDYGP